MNYCYMQGPKRLITMLVICKYLDHILVTHDDGDLCTRCGVLLIPCQEPSI